MTDILIGIVIGMIFGMPVGVIGVLTIHKTITQGLLSGLFTGLGSSAADVLYGIVACFGIGIFSDFVTDYQGIITVLGSITVVLLGVNIFLSKKKLQTKNDGIKGIKCFLTSFAIGITNPVTIITFFMAFTMFGVQSPLLLKNGIMLITGIFVGTYIWWFLLTISLVKLKNKIIKFGLEKVNKFFGILIIFLGVTILLKSIIIYALQV